MDFIYNMYYHGRIAVAYCSQRFVGRYHGLLGPASSIITALCLVWCTFAVHVVGVRCARARLSACVTFSFPLAEPKDCISSPQKK